MRLVVDAAEIDAIAAAIAAAPLAAFDLEFVSADRLVPLLALVQVAWLADGEHRSLDAGTGANVATPPDEVRSAANLPSPGAERGSDAIPEVRLVDPIAADPGPIVRALAAHPLVLAHAPRQDLALLAARFDVAIPGLVDTQLMAAFAGMGDQVGYATLANELLGTSLAKDQQWTAWDKRPLSAAQLVYAEADVRYLPAIYRRLAARLGTRVAWVRAETALVGDDALAAARVTPETAWQHVGGTRGLDAAAHAAMVALAAWRQRTAIELDRPLGQVLADKPLVELARKRPSTTAGVRELKGLAPIAKTRAEAIAGVLAGVRDGVLAGARDGVLAGVRDGVLAGVRDGVLAGARDGVLAGVRDGDGGHAPAPASTPALTKPPSLRAQRWAEALLAIAHVVADDVGIAPRLIATRGEAEDFARTADEHGLEAAELHALPALASWRKPILGEVWLGWLDGRLALVGDRTSPHGIKLRS